MAADRAGKTKPYRCADARIGLRTLDPRKYDVLRGSLSRYAAIHQECMTNHLTSIIPTGGIHPPPSACSSRPCGFAGKIESAG